jgi:phage tail-like protein
MPQLFTEYDALTGHTYQIEIDGVGLGQFQEVSGLSIERQVIEHYATLPGGQEVLKKEPGPIKYGDITLKRGMTDNDELYQWMNEIVEGNLDAARRNGSIVEYDLNFGEVNRWNFVNGWPSKWEAPSHKANSNEIAVESITIAIEKLEKG